MLSEDLVKYWSHYKAQEYTDVVCALCNNTFHKKVNSIRVNIKNNGFYRCQKCQANVTKKSVAKKLKEKRLQNHTPRCTDKIDAKCAKCGISNNVNYRTYKANLRRNNQEYICKSCGQTRAHNDGKYDSVYTDSFIDNLKQVSKDFWSKQNIDDWKQKFQSDGHRKLMSEYGKKAWQDPTMRNKIICATHTYEANLKRSKTISDPKFIEKLSKNAKNLWAIDSYRQNIIESVHKHYQDKDVVKKHAEYGKAPWQDLSYKNKMAIARSKQPRVSSIQTTLYSILDDLGIKYYREYPDKEADKECVIGPYNFDCVIPRGNKTLLIECQGDYWHNNQKTKIKDCQKVSYITNNFPNYELKYLWEHEFKCKNKIIELIKYWMGITELELIDYKLKNVEIRHPCSTDYKLLLSKYHYLPNAGRGGLTYGAYLGNMLIGICVFSSLVRQNIPEDFKTTVDLSRLCIHPRYQKKNFASWFITKCIKKLPKKYKTIIAYSDTTFNHLGTVYKAANFKKVGEIRPDYWYVDEDGWVMHKKTLYDHAVRMGIREREFADKNKYEKVYSKKKLKFRYARV